MALLRLVIFVLLASACYSPDIRDCAVACSRATDCAPDQVCGGTGFCARPEVTCPAITTPDGGVDAPSPPPPVDAAPDAPPDAAIVRIWVRIEGRGDVTIPTVGDCDGGSGQQECMFEVSRGAPTTLHATPKNGWRFDRWDDACKDALTATCVISPTSDTDVRVRFERLDDGDDD